MFTCLLVSVGNVFGQDIPRPEHPRPDWERTTWLNLNGEWEFAETDDNNASYTDSNAKFPDKIIVPFVRESKLSGLGRLGFIKNVWYRRTFTVPADFAGKRVNFNIGACDWRTTIWVNGVKLGTHTGGNVAFGFEATNALKPGENTVVVHAYDDTRSGVQALGKQSTQLNSYGCWYTRTTGIWQTVWLEGVGTSYLKNPKIETDPANGRVYVRVEVDGYNTGLQVKARVLDGGKVVAEDAVSANWRNNQLLLDLGKSAKKWSPKSPFLYDLELELSSGGKVVDKVKTYFGVRTIQIEGRAILINGEAIFQRLVLDQGFYPDGIWTAPSDAALKKDIQLSLDCGFNGARLHQKVFEPRFLYWADKMGYMVWGEFSNWGPDFAKLETNKPFIDEWVEILLRDRNHPAIITWCPFNETPDNAAPLQETIVRITRAVDPSRPVIETSGWSHRIRDPEMLDNHDYDQNPESYRARYDARFQDDALPDYLTSGGNNMNVPFYVGEYGGIGWAPKEASSIDGGWGYGNNPKTIEDFYTRFDGLAKAQLENPNLFGFCYTQLTDVELEINGMYFYDEARTPKFDNAKIKKMLSVQAAYEKNPPVKPIAKKAVSWKTLIGSEKAPDQFKTVWKYTKDPIAAKDWMNPDFDDSSWSKSSGEFSDGARGDKRWRTPQIHLRQTFDYDGSSYDEVILAIRWDNDAKVYVNGKLLKDLPAWSDNMQAFDVSADFKKLVKKGKNTIAVECLQDVGGQAIDLELLLKTYKK